MARLRKNETSINPALSSASAAAPARRAAAAPRKRTNAKSADESLSATVDFSTAAIDTVPSLSEPTFASFSETAVTDYSPTHEEISALAYSYWVERGFAEGCPEHDWLRAEEELRRRGPASV